ncbi:MAG: ParB/RepB/Spo0J family partition protein [Alphaproteobacteria bacterium]|nr:ParB/RepB/Spo0J family partition protein [Alphaproteobacteria bacterium]
MSEKRGLGRGLSALLGEDANVPEREATAPAKGARTVPIDQIYPGWFQPRRNFDETEMNALVESIAAQGILQPLLVRPHPKFAGAFEILAGERRWRAAQRAQLHDVPVIVKEIGDREALEIALVENIQRSDLNAIEEAQGYRRLIDEFGHTQEALATALGKSRSHIANLLRLLTLPQEIKDMVADGRLSMGHARALVGLAAEPALALATAIVRDDLNVRQAERAAKPREQAEFVTRKGRAKRQRDANIVALERELSAALGLMVEIAFDGKGGALTIRYASLDQLDDVLKKLRAMP